MSPYPPSHVNDKKQLDLASYGALVRRRVRLIALITVAAAGLAFGGSLLQSETYEASAELLFRQDEPVPRVDPSEPPPDAAESPERVAATNLELASLDLVAGRVKRTLPTQLTVEELRESVSLEPQGQADIVTVTAEGDSPAEATRLANAFAQEVVAMRRENSRRKVQRVVDVITAQLAGLEPGSELATTLERRRQQLTVEKQLRTGDVEIVQRAIPPDSPSSPKPIRNGLIGGVVGLILALLLVPLLHRFDRRLDSEEELPEIVGAPVIARIPVERTSGWEAELYAEAFQFLRANLQLRDSERRQTVLAVTSPLPGDGKSTVVAELAAALAMSGAAVIAVDCDLRRPMLHHQFAVDDASDGLTTALVGLRDPVELLRATGQAGVRLLPAGPLIGTSASVLASAHAMGEVLDRLRAEADYVIVDTSPVTIGAEASAIASIAEATILVVDADSLRRDALTSAAAYLRHARAKVVGVVVNRAEMLKQSAYRSYFGDSGMSMQPWRSVTTDSHAENGGANTLGVAPPRSRRRSSREEA